MYLATALDDDGELDRELLREWLGLLTCWTPPEDDDADVPFNIVGLKGGESAENLVNRVVMVDRLDDRNNDDGERRRSAPLLLSVDLPVR